MLSDTCFQIIDELLEAITSYNYTDDFKTEIIYVITILNEIRDRLDNIEGDLLINDKNRSIRTAVTLFERAVRRRDMSSINVYDLDSSNGPNK